MPLDPFTVVLLVAAGLAAGFVAGLVGVGGGIVFAPVLFVYFERSGVAPAVLAPLTIGSSLLCTLLAALASAWFHERAGAVRWDVALRAGLASAAGVLLTTRLVTTRPWYDGTAFQVVFGSVLLVVAVRMLVGRRRERDGDGAGQRATRWRPALIGLGAGAVSAAAGVGGGVVLVPAYGRVLGLAIHRAVGTSSATIVLVSLAGVVAYAVAGLDADVPATALGFVDVGRALLLAVPAAASARLGVWAAHRLPRRPLRWAFAALALGVSLRLLAGAL